MLEKEKIMKLITLASGSKGNCTYLETDNVKILIDAGITLTELESKLTVLAVNPSQIYAILITHEHSDHIKSVGAFARKYGCFVFALDLEWQVLDKKLGRLEDVQKVKFGLNTFYIEDLTICPFKLSHDAYSCVGYSFYNQGNKVSIATDFGVPNKNILENLKDSNILILEANHDENLLLNNPKYSALLKQRILSSKGHISNKTCANVIRNIFTSNLTQIILAHLSEENNTPMLAYQTVKAELEKYGLIEGKHLYIDVATQHNMGHLFELKNKNN